MKARRIFLYGLIGTVLSTQGLLVACGPAELADSDEVSGPPPFSGGVPNGPSAAPGQNVAPSASPSPSGNTASGTGGSTGSSNEGAQNGQVPVNANGTGGNGYSAPSTGTGGSVAQGSGGTGAAAPTDPGPQQPDPTPQQPDPTPQQPQPEPPQPLPTPPGQAFFFDDFEAGAAGTQPAAWARWIDYSNNAANALGNAEYALLDRSESVSGNQAVRFHTERATQPAMITLRLPANLTRVYVRAFVMSRIAVGGVAPDAVSNHETMIGLRAVSNDGNNEIRFGGAKGALGFNMVGPGRNDAVAPLANFWGSGPGMQPGQWHCVEIAFLNDGTPRAIAQLDGNVVRDVASTAGWHIPVAEQWLNGLYNEVILGWQSFSNAPANDVWMDDVVLSTAPVGCD